MSWILPVASLPSGGTIRSVGRFDRKAYQRAYYHAKRKPNPVKLTPAQKAKKAARRRELYYQNIDQERATARARYWRNRDKYAAAALDRKRRKQCSGD